MYLCTYTPTAHSPAYFSISVQIFSQVAPRLFDQHDSPSNLASPGTLDETRDSQRNANPEWRGDFSQIRIKQKSCTVRYSGNQIQSMTMLTDPKNAPKWRVHGLVPHDGGSFGLVLRYY